MTDREKFEKLMKEFDIETKKEDFGDGIHARISISDLSWIGTDFLFDENGKFIKLDCYD